MDTTTSSNNFEMIRIGRSCGKSTTKKRRTRRFILFLLRVLRFFVVDFPRRRRRIMFSAPRLLKVSGVCFVTAVFLLASLTTAQAQSSRVKSAASYFARGSEWHARGEFERAIDDYGIAITFDPGFTKAYYARARARLSKG